MHRLWLLALAAAAATAAQPDVPCKTDMDCSLNGECVNNLCVCDPGWTTRPAGLKNATLPGCGYLDFLPAAKNDCGGACVYAGGGVNKVSWGGSVLPDGNGGYNMFVAEMVNNCSLSNYGTNSQVVLATSQSPNGPFERQKVILPPFAHNPEAIRASDGTWVLYTLGTGVATKPIKDCNAPSTGHEEPVDTAEENDASAVPDGGRSSFMLHYTDDVHGEWKNMTMDIKGYNPKWKMVNWNPAPVLLPDGTVRVMIHTLIGRWAGIAIIEAPSWQGPYTVMDGQFAGDDDNCTLCEEDPFMWVDKRGNWHALYHRMYDAVGELSPYWGHPESQKWVQPKSALVSPGWPGGHAFSKDGLTWSTWNRCYDSYVTVEDGSTNLAGRIERPKLLFAADGTPTHLYNGALTKEWTHTIGRPLNVPSNRKQ
eukprot:TRINITY_DN1501_c0_g1_i1.p1 TRINITY_DN1501_c0_g1~~TRINITY_DN1501_c0_g1_i1.p1  ORF type:complete len:424 (+),score=136.29 TRINITY_DN1501_c0_g1_i1:66-1337(+)